MSDSNDIERERAKLGFKEAVRQHFKFLGRYGFNEILALTTIVQYRNRNLDVCVYHGRLSYEIGVEIYQADERFTIGELIRLSDEEAYEKYRSPMVSSSSVALDSAIERLATLLSKYGEKALQNDYATFDALRKQGVVLVEQLALDVLESQIRPLAAQAFRERRYKDAAKLYKKISARLSNAERAKLAFARKQS